MNTIDKINKLSELQAQGDVMNAHFDELRNHVLTPEIKAQLDDIEAERKTSMESLQVGMDQLMAEIKSEVIQAGATINGNYLQAVFSKGRVSWDTKALDGYALAHPEISPMRKQGEPSVSIRGRK